MKRLTRIPRRRATLGIVAGVALLTIGMLALPALASADEHGQPGSAAECAERVAGHDFPRMTRFIDDLVADGVIDTQQALEIEARVREEAEQSCIVRLLLDRGDVIDVTAGLTGTSERQVLRALRQGDSLAGYASEHDVSKQQLSDAIVGRAAAQADALVAGGGLTREQADAALDHLREGLDWFLEREFGRWRDEALG